MRSCSIIKFFMFSLFNILLGAQSFDCLLCNVGKVFTILNESSDVYFRFIHVFLYLQ